MKVSIDCFFLLAITNSVSKLKHNYVVVKLFLEELISMSLLIETKHGLKSGKNNSTLSIKVLPQSLMMHTGKQFLVQFLDQVKIPWVLYNESCNKLVISSSSAQLFEGRNHRPGYFSICKVFSFHKFTIANFIFCFSFFFYKCYHAKIDSSDSSQKFDMNFKKTKRNLTNAAYEYIKRNPSIF